MQYFIIVIDNGMGILEEVQFKVFQFNFIIKFLGMGFGLAMCKNMMIVVGGDIYFEMEFGKGMIFFMVLLDVLVVY